MQRFAICLLPLGLLSVAHASAQEALPSLPAVCAVRPAPHAGHAMDGEAGGMDGSMSGGAAADAGHRALMDSMKAMNGMAAAMAAPDLDVAFVCGMIPHHRAAIAMAEAELAHGDDPFARRMAGEIIAAQKKEIAEMTAWLEKLPQP